jgi:hypothetical protein
MMKKSMLLGIALLVCSQTVYIEAVRRVVIRPIRERVVVVKRSDGFSSGFFWGMVADRIVHSDPVLAGAAATVLVASCLCACMYAPEKPKTTTTVVYVEEEDDYEDEIEIVYVR